MPITHQAQVVQLTAAADHSGKEGCFVAISAGKAALTTAHSTAADTFGVIISGSPKDVQEVIALPGHSGIVEVALHSGASTVTVGTRLYLGASGTVTTGETGTLVAIALANGTAGHLVEARLVEPADVAAVEDVGGDGGGGDDGGEPGQD